MLFRRTVLICLISVLGFLTLNNAIVVAGNGKVILVSWHSKEDILAVVYDRDMGPLSQGDQSIWLVKADGEPIVALPIDPKHSISDLKWDTSGNYLAVLAHSADGDLVFLLDTHDFFNPVLLDFPINHPTMNDIAWSPDSTLVALNYFETLEIWNVSEGEKITSLKGRAPGHGLEKIAWNSNGLLAEAGSEQIYIWDLNQPETPIAILPMSNTSTFDIAWNKSGNQLAVGNRASMDVWTWNNQTLSYEQTYSLKLDDPDEFFWDLEWQGARLASLTWNANVRIWNTETWGLVDSFISLDGGHALGLNLNSFQIAYGKSDGTLALEIVPPTDEEMETKVTECIADNELLASLNAKIDAGQWQDFINEVEAQQDNEITSECANTLVEMAGFLLENPPSKE